MIVLKIGATLLIYLTFLNEVIDFALGCEDKGGHFEITSVKGLQGTKKSCAWVKQSATTTKCKYTEINQHCPLTCELCEREPDSKQRTSTRLHMVTANKHTIAKVYLI